MNNIYVRLAKTNIQNNRQREIRAADKKGQVLRIQIPAGEDEIGIGNLITVIVIPKCCGFCV